MSDDDSYVLPNEGSSGEDEDDDSEDETLDQLARHANRGREDENEEPVVNEANDIRPAAVDEEREERRARYEDQREERRIQLQMHQESMRQQSQFMTSMMIAIMGGQRALPTVQPAPAAMSTLQNNEGEDRGSAQRQEEGKTEESEGEI